jgi:hypothetical protein
MRLFPRVSVGVALVVLVPISINQADTDKARPEEKKLFDGKSLTSWKAIKFGDEGKVEVKDGAIVLSKGKPLTGIVYSKGDFPKMDYEVTLEGKKIAGDDFFCTTTFPVADAHCSFVVGGWRGTVVGISNVNGSNASENETNKYKEFKRDQWYRLRIRVTTNRIEAWIDKEKMVDLDTSDVTLSLHIASRPCRPFGIASYETTGAVRDIRVRPLSEAEKKAARKKE